ncbi:unnamed protein product [Withania somnifera]
MNAVKSYFNRNWTRRDLLNTRKIRTHAHENLITVYFTLFSAMLSATLGSNLHLFFEAGGLFTVISSVASLLCLCLTSPQRVRIRVSLLMIATFFCGASVGVFTKYLFEINQITVANFLAGTTIGIAFFSGGALITRERFDIYICCLVYCWHLILFCFIINFLFIIDCRTASSMYKVIVVLILFMGYFVVYSQEILYDARFGDIDFVNRTLTVFFNLPAILVHAARVLYQGATTEQTR